MGSTKSPDLKAITESRCTTCGELLNQKETKKGWTFHCPECKLQDEKSN